MIMASPFLAISWSGQISLNCAINRSWTPVGTPSPPMNPGMSLPHVRRHPPLRSGGATIQQSGFVHEHRFAAGHHGALASDEARHARTDRSTLFTERECAPSPVFVNLQERRELDGAWSEGVWVL